MTRLSPGSPDSSPNRAVRVMPIGKEQSPGPMSYPFLQTTEAVEDLARKLRGEPVIGVDTEADSFFHYFEKLCLVQIAAKSGIYLIDPLALGKNGLKPLARIFADPSVRKIFHAAEYDLYVLQRHSGIKIRNLFDTMVSAQLLGYPSVGLASLVERHFDVKLSKDQQRTDWSRRPLRSAQLEYAGADVKYLIEVSRILERELKAKKRLSWAMEEFRACEKRVWPERSFDKQGYLKIKGAKKLPARGLAILRELYLMRDQRARGADRPPFRLLGNGTLIDLAQNPPRSRRSYTKRKGVTELVMRRMGQEITEAVARGLEGPEHPPIGPTPARGARKRLDRRGEGRLDLLKQWRVKRAKELELDPGVFCPNATLEQIACADCTSLDELHRLTLLKDWWVDAFGDEALRVTETERADKTARSMGERPRKRPRSGEQHSSKGAPVKG